MPTVNLVTTVFGKKVQGAWPLDKTERHARQARRRPRQPAPAGLKVGYTDTLPKGGTRRGVYAPPLAKIPRGTFRYLSNIVQSGLRRFGKTASVPRETMDYEKTRNRMAPAAHTAVAKFFRGTSLR